jgi:hypothetical protein
MSNIQLPSSPADRQKIKNAIDEISKSMTRIEAERDLILETVKDTCKNFTLPRRAFRKLVSVYHKQTFNEECASHEEFETLYETLAK